MKRFTFILLLSGLSCFTHAQNSSIVPGFLGKRIHISYGIGTFIFFERNLAEEVNLFENFPTNTRLSLKQELSLNYVVSRKISLGASIIYARQKGYYGIKSVLINGPSFPEPYSAPVLPYNSGVERGRIAYQYMLGEMHIQFYRRNFIAPAGLYHQLGIGFVQYSPIVSTEGILNAQPVDGLGTYIGPSLPQVLDNNGRYTTFRLSYQRGRNTPLNKHFYLNTAFGINFFLGGQQQDIAFATPAVQTFSDSIVTNIYNNIRRQNTFELKIGLGWFAY